MALLCSAMVKNGFVVLKNIQIEVWGKFIGHCDVILSAFLQFPVRALEKMAQNQTSRWSAMKTVPKTSEKKSQYYLYVWSTIPSVWSENFEKMVL